VKDPTPVVLLSFSTVPEQRSPAMLQCALDALGHLPVHVVATTGGIVDPKELTAPANAHLEALRAKIYDALESKGPHSWSA
jgi:UDP:flavonoid glycosyltransferase YjiC (YdhE family)